MWFDGASSMKCLAKLVKTDINASALYVHCFAHCNELVFKDASAQSDMMSDAQVLCEDIYALVGVSPKRIGLFENLQEDGDTKRLKSLSRTRWTTRGQASEVILEKHKELTITVKMISNDKTNSPECRAKARGS